MAKTKQKGWHTRFDIMFNYYSHYYDYFQSICNIVSVYTDLYPDGYWEKYRDDVLHYLIGIARTENVWSLQLLEIVENERGRYSTNEVERFLFWFIVHTYQIDRDTDFKQLKKTFRQDYKKSWKASFN